MESDRIQYTAGDGLESANLADLDARLEAIDLFRVYPEVSGYQVAPRLGTEHKDLRIDRVLVPNRRLIEMGWANGIIGIEGKKGGHKVGPLVLQALDYTRAVWRLPQGGIDVVCRYVLIYPCEKLTGDIESIAVQNRIGRASLYGETLTFHSGRNMLRVFAGHPEIANLTAGAKAGSR